MNFTNLDIIELSSPTNSEEKNNNLHPSDTFSYFYFYHHNTFQINLEFLVFFFFFFFFKILFIHERHRERERQRHRQREKQAHLREPDMQLDPSTPGSRPGPKAGAKPLSYPGIPQLLLFLVHLFFNFLTRVVSDLCTVFAILKNLALNIYLHLLVSFISHVF